MIREAQPEDGPAIAALEQATFGSDAWSDGLVREGLSGTIPGALYLVAATDEEPDRGLRRRQPVRRRLRAPADHGCGLATGGAGSPPACSSAWSRRRACGTPTRLLLEVREDNTAACGFYAARGFVEINRRTRYYSDGTTAVVLAKEL